MADDSLKPAYLIAGDDGAKVDTALSRLRARAEREGGAGALESFLGSGMAGPDVDELINAMPAISLMAERRYLLADGVERWRATQVKRLGEAFESIGEDLTVVLVARGSAPKGLADVVKKARGAILSYEAPNRRSLPSWIAEEARRRGFEIAAPAARSLATRLGESTIRLATELDRIALWAEPGARLGIEETEELTADTSERMGWTLGDAIVAREPADAVEAADALVAQGEAVTPLIYGMATRLRAAHLAAAMLEKGRAPKEIEAALPMAPYPSKLMVKAVRGVPAGEMAAAIEAIAELEWWTRGGSDYDERLALTLAVREAAGTGSAA